MAKSSRNSPSVSTFADHEVIVPEHKLRSALAVTGDDLTPDLDAIARAEAALAELAGEFDGWMRSECDRLDEARVKVKATGLVGATRDDLFRAAHDIKGEAATFGYPLAAEAAESLCRLIEHTPDPTRVPVTLIDQHVDGVRAIIREDVRETGHEVAAALAATLRRVTDEFLVAENKHRPGYLDGIVTVAPPLAPAK
ncbi:MAG: Hpt domain-containing protein [Variibacter sp.]|nr:Hpt domain-containing protein [Variibacter sp.]